MKKQRNVEIWIAILFFLLIGVWVIKIINDEVPFVDQWTRAFPLSMADTHWYTFFRTITTFGSRTFLIPFTIVMALCFWWMYRDWFPALLLSGGTLFTHYFNQAIKYIVARERPTLSAVLHAKGYSFPSGHAMISLVCYGLVAYFIVKKLHSSGWMIFIKMSFGFIVLLIGLSRFIINVHYVTDIVSGFFIGMICLEVFIYLDKRKDLRRAPS
ncbi:MAG TPA: phosphatase PAP2 family protein [Bacillota bacterium]